jgi:hypothetical protein
MVKQIEKDEHLHANTRLPKMSIKDMKDGRTRMRVQFDITWNGSAGKVMDPKSETEPDLTMTLGTLLERHSRGKDVPMRDPVYFETQVPTFSDLTDLERYKEQLATRLEEVKSFIANEAEQANAAEARLQAEQEKAAEAAKDDDSKGKKSKATKTPSTED